MKIEKKLVLFYKPFLNWSRNRVRLFTPMLFIGESLPAMCRFTASRTAGLYLLASIPRYKFQRRIPIGESWLGFRVLYDHFSVFLFFKKFRFIN